ncbi:hypothetical protein [Taibaiella koreensis]|uniref:hypothetical protein n=1 Tax=Taibaiella koreensis TaxID=1268548 RepID=UPI000E599FFF|nr:hypothetical protein [Taibaiella koreensis]
MRPFYRVLSYIVMILQSLAILVLLHYCCEKPGRPDTAAGAESHNMVVTTFQKDSCWYNN